MTDYLKLAQETPAAPAADPSNPYLDLARQDQAATEARTRTVLELALKDKPDVAAERQRLAKSAGLPLQVVERNLDQVRLKEQARQIDLIRMAQDSPVLMRQLGDPTFTTTAIDDLDTLTQIEKSVGNAVRYMMGAAPGGGITGDLKASVFRSSAAAAGVQRAAVDVIEPWARLVAGDDNWFKGVSDWLTAQGKAANATADRMAPATGGNVGKGVSSGVQSFAMNAKYLPLAALGPAGAAGALGAMVTESFGTSYNKAADANLPLWQSLGYASADAMVEYWTEKLPLDALIGGIKQGAPFIKVLGKQMALEIPGEQLATTLQDLNEWAVLNPGKPFSGYLAERPDAMVQTLIATVIGTGGNVMVTSGIGKVADSLYGTQWRDNVTTSYQAMLDEQLKLAGGSLLRERSPEQFRAHVQAVVDQNEGAPRSIHVDGAVLNQLPDELKAQLPQAVRDQIDQAAASGDTVEIPMADVLTLAPGTPLEQVLNEHARMDPFAQSMADVKAAAGQAQEFLKQEAERVIQQASDQETFRASSEAVKATILGELNTAARYRPAVNEGMATWATAFYTTMASRVDMTPEQFYAAHRLRILGAPSATAAGPVMDQGKPGEVTVEGYHFSSADRPTLTTGAFGTGLRGSARDEIMSHPDKRLKERLSFYVDLGQGITPESGVGGRAHRAQLTNVYDSDADPLKLRGGDARAFEAKVLDAGYSGYLSRMGGASQGQVIMLGQQAIRPELLGAQSRITNGQRPPALPRVAPTWQTQASGEPAMMQAKLEKMQASPSWAGYDLRVEGRELQARKKGAVQDEVFNQTPAALPAWSTMKVKGARITAAIKKAAISLAPKASLARRNYDKLDAIFAKVPNPLESEEAWLKFQSLLVGDGTVLGVPYEALKYAQSPAAVSRYLSRLRPDQLASRRAGFELGAKIREQYAAGQAPALITGRLLLWAMLSRKAGAYPHEAAYMDLVNGGVDEWIRKAVDGNWTEEDGAGYVAWSSDFMASKKGGTSPSAGVTSNANDYGRILLTKMSEKDADGRTQLTRLHDLIADQDVSTDQVRREFFALGDSLGIQNKVLSFALLVTGRWDTLVLDRVQFTHLWGDTYRERAGQRNIYDLGLAAAGEGHFGLAVYEALARGMSSSLRQGYADAGLTGEGDGTLGAFHWDSWLIESSQAIGHPTIESLMTDRPRPDLAVRQGKFDTFSYNFEYRADGQYQIPLLDGSGYRIISPAEASAFQSRLRDDGEGVVPKDFGVSKNKSAPWVDAEGVDRARYDAILNEYGRRADAADVAPAGIADAGGSVQGDAAPAAGSGAGGTLAQDGGVDEQQTGDRGGRYSSGGLAPLEGAPAIVGATGPDPRVVAVAEQYARDNGIDLRRQGAFAEVDPERATRIAAAYEAMQHAPNDPAVKAAYEDLAQQTLAQYLALQRAGYKFWFMDPGADPYQGNPWNAMRDLRANQSMAVFPTEAGFGSGGQVNIGLADPNGGPNLDPATVLEALRVIGAEVEGSVIFASDTEPTLVVKVKKALTKEQGDFLSGLADQEAIAQRTDDEKGSLFGPMAEKWGPFNPEFFVTPTGARADTISNPLLADTGITWPYGSPDGEARPVMLNDLFRAVHDAFGHGMEGAGFRANGEENAWQAHNRLFTGPALGALTSETRGQNSWLNYGPHGETNQTAKVEDTVFAEQKTGLMPEWTWTEGRVEDANENLEQAAASPRGTFNPKTLELVLNPNANLSTFFHETGHFFLEVMADIASQPNAPAQIVEDMGTFLKWAGVKDLATWSALDLDGKRKYHERWAESIEQYVMEGRAPSAELAPLMRRFATWLKSVYGSIQKMLAARPGAEQTPLNDDIRRVMDRMLATDEQIAQANEVAGLVPDADADALAAERLNKRSMADLKWSVKARDQVIAKLRKQAAAIEKDIRAEVAVEVDQTPEMRAKRALDALTVSPEFAGMLAEHKAARKAAETTVRDEVKAALLAENPDVKGLVKGQLLMKNKRDIDNKVDAAMIKWDAANPAPKRPVNQTDADVATIADSFGFESIDGMLQAIDAYGPRKAAIEGLTDQRMLEEHGDLVDERAIMEAANEAVHNEARARSLATELRTQREMLNPRTDTGETNAKGSKITVNALIEAAKQFGANVVSRTVLRDLKAKVWQHTAAERRAGKAWQEATAKGDTTAAVKAKQDQVLNNAAAKATIDARAEAAKIFDFFKRVTRGNDETVVEKGRDADMVNAARAVLAAYGVQSSASKGAAEYLDKVAQNDPETYNVIKPMVDGALLNAQPLNALTFEELQALHEEIQAIWFLAKRIRQMEVDGDLMDVEDAAAEVYARLEEIGIPDTVPGETGALTRAEETARRWLQQVPALGRRVEQWAEGKDGKFGGPFLRFIFNPIKDAADKYRTARLEYRKKFEALVSAIAPSMRNELIHAPELGYTFGRGHNGIGTAELLHAILHTGNESNKRKLLLGRGWATDNGDGTIDTAKWDAFVARLVAEGKLTKAHYDFAQGVWDLLEQTKPLAQQTHRAVFGRYFAEVTADAFVTPFGTYRGGYVPAQADPALVQDADLRELLETENAGMSQAFPTTNKGFTKSRVEYNRPLKLDLRTLGQHIDKVLLFSYMEPAVRGAAKLLRQKNVAQPLARVDPAAMGGMLKPWLNRSARQTVETPIAGDAGLNRLASTIRGRVGMALMFANVSNTLQQITGFLPASLRVKPALMLRAAAQFIRHPKQTRESVWGLSPYMADRASNEVAVLSDTMEKILIDPSVYERAEMWTRQHGYFLQTAFDNVMSPIIWSAAYNQGVAEGMDERLAIRFADGTIRQTQGSTLAEDVSRIETGPAYARLFTQFIGYFNMVANTNATALQQIASEQGLKKGAGKAFGVVMLGLLAPIWVAEAIAHAMRGGPDDEDDDGYLDDWLAAVFGFGTIRGILSGVPFIGAAAQSAVNRFNDQPADDKFSLSPTVSVLESAVGSPASVYKAIVNDGNAQKAVRDVSALITVATGLPAMTLARPVGYAAGVAQGKIEPTGPVDAARGLITGSASPDSKQR